MQILHNIIIINININIVIANKPKRLIRFAAAAGPQGPRSGLTPVGDKDNINIPYSLGIGGKNNTIVC